ncbi:ATP-binding protein [Candidatus Woesearchaeota archaeon]|nr:ATP-binding protein [Candidatus Woesearchaeota archaeon]
MSGINYLQAKELILKQITYQYSSADGNQLPPIEFQLTGDSTKVQFGFSEETDIFKVVSSVVKTLGDVKAESYGGDINLRGDKLRIYVDSSKYNRGIIFYKEGAFSDKDINTIISAYTTSHSQSERKDPKIRLSEMGVTIYTPNPNLTWDYLAGYETVKQKIRDTVILSLKHPEIYEKIVAGTRKYVESNRPKAVLFEGPPGTGKTTSARIIAGEAQVPLLYVPIESIMTKWYGESEKNLANIFKAGTEIGDTLFFLDEIDSLALSRDQNMHEATRRVLSVLLRQIDGFLPNQKTIIIGATNRKNDLDPALLSRFDISINFPLPNLEERISIFGNYAKQLTSAEVEEIAKIADGVSGRNIKDICEHAERRWASQLIRGEVCIQLPTAESYISSLKDRQSNGI